MMFEDVVLVASREGEQSPFTISTLPPPPAGETNPITFRTVARAGSTSDRAIELYQSLPALHRVLEQRGDQRIVVAWDQDGSPSAAELPWERMRDSAASPPLGAVIPVVRCLSARADHKAAPPVRLFRPRLLIVRAGDSTIASGLDQELSAIRTAWEVEQRGHVRVIDGEGLDKIEQVVHEADTAGNPFDVVHYMGHGVLDEEGGRVVLPGPEQDALARFVAIFADCESKPQLVVLNCCHGASVPKNIWASPFSGVTQALIQAGVDRVIASASVLDDAAATEFASDLHRNLAEGKMIEAAYREAFRSVYTRTGLDGIMPGMYVRPHPADTRTGHEGDSPFAVLGDVYRLSYLWLPQFLNHLAKTATALCGADGCSIYLKSPQLKRLMLAATTRAEQRSRLFDTSTSYTLNPRQYADGRDSYEDEVGITGWVALVGHPINLKSLANEHERADVASDLRAQYPGKNIPTPRWSPKNRSFYDLREDTARPLLAVPIRFGGETVGVIRVSTVRERPQRFTTEHQHALQELADRLGAFLGRVGLPDDPKRSHVFRVWAAEGRSDLASRITEAVPILFDVDCCSLFLCDPDERFVLREAGASRLSRSVKREFDSFRRKYKDDLYYTVGDQSKTATCLQEKAPIVLRRREDESWVIDGLEGMESTRLQFDPRHEITCLSGPKNDYAHEFPSAETRLIMLVPVRDVLNARRIAGLLRIVSGREHGDVTEMVQQISQFASELADRIGSDWRDERLRDVTAQLEVLAAERPAREQWLQRTAEIIGERLDAGTVTVFLFTKDRREIEPVCSWLSSKYNDELTKGHHEKFKSRPEFRTYRPGQGRTGWVALNGKVLNFKNVRNQDDMRRVMAELGVEDLERAFDMCELPEPGPALFVPIRGAGGPIHGVLRVLRRLDTTHGNFVKAHEDVLAAAGALLAGLIEPGSEVPPSEQASST